MLTFIKRIFGTIELAADLREIASRYAGQPEQMRECMLEAIRKDVIEEQARSSVANHREFKTVTA